MLTNNEIEYTIKVIFNIAFPNIKVKINRNEVFFNNQKIIFFIMNDSEYKKLIKGQLSMQKIDNFDSSFKIPIYNLKKNFLLSKNNKININADIITLSFLLLSRKEEIEIGKFDEHNRFMYEKSLSKKYNLIEFPIVDEYAYLLRKKLERYITVDESPNLYNIYLTHDIDNFNRFGGFFKNIKTIIGDITIRKSIKMMVNTIQELINTKCNSMLDPKIQAICEFIDKEKDLNVNCCYFFLAYNKNDSDYRYDINDKRVGEVIKKIISNKMHFGIHCGLNAYNDFDKYNEQKEKLNRYGKIKENRNHYLEFDPLNTVSILENNQIEYDYSLGYPDQIGFKCGTCHEFYLYDLKKNRQSHVIERPLIIMDGSLKVNMKLECEEALNTIIKYKKMCERLNGNFIILWHPDSVIREWKPFYQNVYLKFLEELYEENHNII